MTGTNRRPIPFYNCLNFVLGFVHCAFWCVVRNYPSDFHFKVTEMREMFWLDFVQYFYSAIFFTVASFCEHLC